MSLYVGPSYVGDPFLNPARRAVFSPTVTSRASEMIVDTTESMVTAVHEAAHAAYYYFNRLSVFSAEIDGNGGGRFRTHDGPDLPLLTGNEHRATIAADDQSKREWVELLIGVACSRHAQRKYCGSDLYDGKCEHDDLVVNRVLSSIASAPSERRDMAISVELGAREFVKEHWSDILKLARVLFARGRLDKGQIEAVLGKRELELNQSAVNHADYLVSTGAVNWGPFTWADDTDGADLLDDDDDDDENGRYHLGENVDDATTAKYHYPFGKGGEVYIEALKDAQQAGGAVADYATKLLTEITAQKKQSYQPKRAARHEGLRWRNDGYLKPFV
jgi:hypothetical protein